MSGNFSIMLWRQHPGNDPDGQYVWWNTGSLVNFGKIADPELQALMDQGRSETDPAKRKAIYQQVNKLFGAKVYNVWAYYAVLDGRGPEERAGDGRTGAARRRRQARVHLRTPPRRGHVVELGELTG